MQNDQTPVDYHAAFLALAVAVTEAYTVATVADDPVRVEDKLAQAFNIVQATVGQTYLTSGRHHDHLGTTPAD